MERSAFSRQPAHLILVDLHGRMDAQTGHNISQALEQFFAIVCSMSGPCRVPFFGLFTVSSMPKVLFPLQHVRSNFARLQSALQQLQLECSEDHTGSATLSCVGQGLMDAVGMFTRQAQSLMQTAGYWSQLEVTVITTRCATPIVRQLEKATKTISLDSLKKIQVLSVSSDDQMGLVDDLMTLSQGSTASDTNSSESSGPGLTECVNLDSDVLSLSNFFKSWLHDCSTESEHLQLIFSSPINECGDGETLVRCDLQERVINPFLLPFQGKAALTLDGQIVRPSVSSGGKGGSIRLPVYRLQVVERVPVDNICESVMFGQPVVLRATSCWKMDWDELENNRQIFHALCAALNQQSEAIVTQVEVLDEPPSAGRGGFRYPSAVPHPRGHYVLLPSHTGTLLLKAMAVAEMMLPVELAPAENVSEAHKQQVATMLNQVGVNTTYNPMIRSGNLHNCLLYHLTKRLPNTTQQNKRKTQSVASRPRGGQGAPSFVKASAQPPYGQKRVRPVVPQPRDDGDQIMFPTEL